MDDEEDEVPTCPLCLEELDATDRAVKACQCGYQVCLWCLHHIREQLTARCPACRTPYQEQNFKFAEVNPEQAAREAKERATAKKERERREKLKEIERERARAVLVSQQKAKNNLKHARILQRNLVYVIGLSLTLAREEVIRRADMFGKYGRMLRILVNRAHPFNADAPGGPSISAYVQYYRDSDATAAVRAMNNAVFDGREIRCAIATTKYCDVFVRSAAASDPNPNAAHHCGNPQCMYYHSISPPDNVLTREEVLARQLGPPPPAHLFLMDPRRAQMQPIPFHRPGLAHPGPLPIGALPNTSVSVAPSGMPSSRAVSTRASATPGSAIPIGSLSMLNHAQHPTANGNPLGFGHPNSQVSNIGIPTDASSIHADAADGHPPMASSPRLRPSLIHATTRKPVIHPQAPSPSASPQRTPPSSPGPRRSAPRLGRSPLGSNASPTPGMPPGALLTAGGHGTTMATSAPFMSSVIGSAQLPSTAGWASTHQGRSSSRSPRRHGPSVSLDDPSRSRPRLMRRREINAPPGFEDSVVASANPVPSRPPGFDAPGGTNASNRAHGRTEVVRSATMPSMPSVSAPPGFGPGPAAPKDVPGEESSATDVAAAWSQEASTDEVFSTTDRRARRPVGVPAQRVGQEMTGDMDSRTELAQVLAKIGGDLGVSSEFQDIKNVPAPLSGAIEQSSRRIAGVVDGNAPHPSLGSLFANQSYRGGYPQASTNSSHRDPRVPAQQAYAYGLPSSTLPSAFGRGAASSIRAEGRPEVFQARRHTSRFGFARNDGTERKSQVPAASIPTPLPAGLASVEVNTSPRVVSKPEALPNSNGMRTESHVISELTRNTPNLHPTSTPAPPQHTRQPRSRFDFVDQESSPPKAQQLSRSGMDSARHPKVSPDTDPENDAFGPTFANLSTAEKLASIFSSAQWSAERLPPMPTYDQQEEVTGQRPEHSETQNLQALGSASVQASITPVNVTDAIEDRTRPPEPPHTQPVQFSPPGFNEATPGISPETTGVENTSATTGVATCVASGGVGVSGAESATSGQTEESQSSETESLEEDRKRSRAQRKRDKKARQLREAAERKALESHNVRHASSTADEAEPTAKPKPQNVVKTSPGLREIMNPSQVQIPAKPKEISKQSKPVRVSDDPGRFMSVSELEREVEAARAREAQLQDRLIELQRRIRSYDNVRT